jgi:hypothetical protein
MQELEAKAKSSSVSNKVAPAHKPPSGGKGPLLKPQSNIKGKKHHGNNHKGKGPRKNFNHKKHK